MSGLYLPATLGPLSRCAASDVGRYAMCGVELTDPGDGTFRCAVSDGRQLLVVRGPCPARGRLNGEAGAPVIVPIEAWQELFRKPSKDYRGNIEPVCVEFDGARLHLATRDRFSTSAPVDGRFPDWTSIIPKTAPAFSINVNPEFLANLLTVIAKILSQDNRKVTLAFWKPDHPMAVVAKDEATGMCLDGLLMPLT